MVIKGEKVGFNVRLGSLAKEEQDQISQTLGQEAGSRLLPLHYFTEFRSSDGQKVEGVFDLPLNSQNG